MQGANVKTQFVYQCPFISPMDALYICLVVH